MYHVVLREKFASKSMKIHLFFLSVCISYLVFYKVSFAKARERGEAGSSGGAVEQREEVVNE